MKNKRKAVIVSGYFNPVHAGHISLFEEAKSLGDRLIVIVNNDEQVKVKGHFPFMNEKERKIIIQSIKYVDLAYLSIDMGRSVSKTIEEIHNLLKEEYDSFIFANGGPRKKGTVPEYDTCKKLGIDMIFDIGGYRQQSSSWLIQNTRRCESHEEDLEYCKDCVQKKAE
jgi:cytidyltransferase-like protein